MANRELSSTLKNLKFMQRATQKKEEIAEEDSCPGVGDAPSSSVAKRCVVIYEADPHPVASSGRMSFLSFNPSIDKLNETSCEQETKSSRGSSSMEPKEQSIRENGFSETKKTPELSPMSVDAKGDLKRKQVQDSPEAQNLSKVRKSDKKKHQDKRRNLDWKVLRPSSSQKRYRQQNHS